MAPGEEIRLGQELLHYESLKDELLRTSEGKFVVIKGTHVAGTYDSFESAYIAGALRFGSNTDFLVKQVLSQEPVFVLYA
jgi:hypothetical protein